jgi:hypothetical protein
MINDTNVDVHYKTILMLQLFRVTQKHPQGKGSSEFPTTLNERNNWTIEWSLLPII